MVSGILVGAVLLAACFWRRRRRDPMPLNVMDTARW